MVLQALPGVTLSTQPRVNPEHYQVSLQNKTVTRSITDRDDCHLGRGIVGHIQAWQCEGLNLGQPHAGQCLDLCAHSQLRTAMVSTEITWGAVMGLLRQCLGGQGPSSTVLLEPCSAEGVYAPRGSCWGLSRLHQVMLRGGWSVML